MTAAVAIQPGARLGHFTWYAPLLLPFLPMMGLLRRAASDAFLGEGWVAVALMALLGVLSSFGLVTAMGRMGGPWRKELEQMRSVWVAALFIVQLAVLLGTADGGINLGLWSFLGACLLLGAIPFGAEFQHRTLSALLSQPVARMEIWRAKMGVLAGALLLLWATLVLSVCAIHGDFDMAWATGLLGAAAVAWGTGPFWTLLTRGLLSGMVFSMLPPMVVATGAAIAMSVLERSDMPVAWQRAGDALPRVLLWGALPLYAAVGAVLAIQRWLKVEAPDTPAAELAGIFVTGRRSSRASVRRLRSPMTLLLLKELHLQTVTLVTAGMMVLVLGLLQFVPVQWTAYTILQGFVCLLAGSSIVLAGATAVAEERRLGTLDGQLLVPASRTSQWRVKWGVAMALSGVGWAGIVLATEALLAPTQWLLVGLAVAALPLATLASTGSPNALRALLASLGLVVVVAVLAGVIFATMMHIENRWMNLIHQSAFAEPEVWIERARQLSETEITEVQTVYRRSDAYDRLIRLKHWLALPLVIPVLGAYFFARRNFMSPVGAPARWVGQAAACLTALVLFGALGAAIYIRGHVNYMRSANLSGALRWLEVDALLSPGERALKRSVEGGILLFSGNVVRVGLRPENADARGPLSPTPAAPGSPRVRAAATVDVHLPLSPTTRSLLIERGQIDEDVRETLRKEHEGASSKTPAP